MIFARSQLTQLNLIGCLLIAGCGVLPKAEAEAQTQPPNSQQGGNPDSQRQRATNVDVAIARLGKLREEPESIGTTTPFSQVSVRSQSEGKLIRLNTDVGYFVQQGQTIAQLDDTLLLNAITQAEAELSSRQAEIDRARTQVNNARIRVEQALIEQQQAQTDATRFRQLWSAGAISRQQAELSQTAAATATQALRVAQEQVRSEQQAVVAAEARAIAQQAVVAQAQERRSYSLIASPLSGVVLEKVVEPGTLVQAGGEILKLGDFSRVKVVVQVSELGLSNIRVGQSVQVRLDAFPNEDITGQVTLIYPAADPTARLVPIEVTIPNRSGRIASGLLARVRFAAAAGQQVVIPQSALQQAGRGRNTSSEDPEGTVFVVAGEGRQPKVTARRVVLGDRANGQVEVLSGLKAGEAFVTRSSNPLKDGAEVRLSVLSEPSGRN